MSCGEPLVGRICHACGERRRSERDLTLAAFMHYALEAVTNADARLYRTLRFLVTAPGLLTREFVVGRRQPYVAPLQLFLLANLVFFVLLRIGPTTDAFTTDLIYHLTAQPLYGQVANTLVSERIGELPARSEGMARREWVAGWSEEQRDFRLRFNEATPRYANSLVILMVPLFAGAIRLLRRQTLFVRELVFSAYFFAFVLLFMVLVPYILLPLYLLLSAIGVTMNLSDAVISLVLALVLGLYLVLAFRTAHGDRWIPAVLRGVAAVVLLFVVLTVYRGILFFVVFWAI